MLRKTRMFRKYAGETEAVDLKYNMKLEKI